MKYRIFADSGADLTAELIKDLEVSVIPLRCTVTGDKDGEIIDGTYLPIEECYALLRKKYSASTAAINVAAFTEEFEKALSVGEDVLYLAFSSGLSTTCNAAKVAAADLAEKYPDRKICIVDTLAASLGEGLLVYYAAKKRDEGADIDEVRDYIESIKLNLCHWFTVDDLFFLKRGGRVSAATAVLGSMLNIKPVLHVDNEGHLINVEKARGRRGSFQALVNHMKATVTDPAEQTVFISHGDCLAEAEILASMVREQIGVKEIVIGYIGSVIGTHSGPGTIALFFLGSER